MKQKGLALPSPKKHGDEVDGDVHLNERRRQAVAFNRKGSTNLKSAFKKSKDEDRFKKKNKGKLDDFDRDFQDDESPTHAHAAHSRKDSRDRKTRKPRHMPKDDYDD